MRFNRIAPADEGRYVCTASNRYGNTTKVAEVIVNSTHEFLPKVLFLNFIFLVNSPTEDTVPFGSTKEAYEGDTVTLKCSDDNPGGRNSRVIFLMNN